MRESRQGAHGLESGRGVAEKDKKERAERTCAEREGREAACVVRLGERGRNRERRGRPWRRRRERPRHPGAGAVLTADSVVNGFRRRDGDRADVDDRPHRRALERPADVDDRVGGARRGGCCRRSVGARCAVPGRVIGFRIERRDGERDGRRQRG